MLTLYTAVGILRFEDCLKNLKTPIVINNHREYGLSEEEFMLWNPRTNRMGTILYGMR